MFNLRIRSPALAAGVTPALLACALACPRFAAAQGTPYQLVGGASNPVAPPNFIQNQIWCQRPTRKCNTPLVPPAHNGGGTAYDPATQVIWDCDGARLIGARATSTPPCGLVCGPVLAQTPPNAIVTGLAFDEGNRWLWQLDSSPGLSWFTTTGTPCPKLVGRCSLAGVFPTTHTPGGLAYSERYKLVFYSASIFPSGIATNIVYAAPASNPCQPICKFPFDVCTGGPPLSALRGLAFDDCSSTLYATDGIRVARGVFLPPPTCTVPTIACCNASLIAPYYGLCLETSHAVSVGNSCTALPCPACPNMVLSAIGDPATGNSLFALRISGAPATTAALGTVGVFLLGPGPCTPGLPMGCGLYHIQLPPPPILLGVTPLLGPPACGGVATQPLPVPLDPVLCGVNLSTQAAVLCAGASGIGMGLTNALDLTLNDT